MGEKNIFAYFKTEDEAKEVEKKIKDLGVIDIQIDRVNKYPLGSSDKLMNPLTGNPSSQATMTLGASSDKNTGVLSSADVSASGMSDGGQDVITGQNILLVAVVDESVYENATGIIREAGGSY
ncbi:hypothetical protein [Desulfosporosinus metallidurans]|uniref:Uncharacterized protein n=1 Tax=Desulfosporosinus metallidurans TaxID=1888891 RepID=A0A1Q8QQ43_9FIRM|nr:hypothetical protein [Desulfosporosinus metallidurans]OLN29412.1 hypothetical protein DSOL_3588 [Desulfosporosinus metallidurans]